MRVIAGEYRSRRLMTPAGTATRPTSDRLRETLFNVLAPRLSGASFADLYAGSGAVGIEALSRGAAFVHFVETGREALAAIRSNLASLGTASRHRVHTADTAQFLRQFHVRNETPIDIVFLDPPYNDIGAYTGTLTLIASEARSLLRPNGLVVAEHASRTALLENYGDLCRTRVLKQGDAALSFFEVAAPDR